MVQPAGELGAQRNRMGDVTKKEGPRLLRELPGNFQRTFLLIRFWPELHHMTTSSYKYYREKYF